MTFKKNTISQVVAVALCGTFAAAAQAAPTYISGWNTEATIDDAGYFHDGGIGSVGLRFNGREYVNEGTFASNYTLQYNTTTNLIADEASGTNPLGASAFPVSSSTEVNLGGISAGWFFSQIVSIPSDGHVTVTVTLQNQTGKDASDVHWGVGIDPDQGIGGGVGFGTTNEIIGTANGAGIKATSMDGYSLTLQNTTSALATAISPYIDSVLGTCCAPIAPDFAMVNSQALGYSVFGDYSINLAYDLGDIKNGQVVSFGYEYVMAVPEPETYAMLLAGLGLIGFSLRRRNA